MCEIWISEPVKNHKLAISWSVWCDRLKAYPCPGPSLAICNCSLSSYWLTLFHHLSSDLTKFCRLGEDLVMLSMRKASLHLNTDVRINVSINKHFKRVLQLKTLCMTLYSLLVSYNVFSLIGTVQVRFQLLPVSGWTAFCCCFAKLR